MGLNLGMYIQALERMQREKFIYLFIFESILASAKELIRSILISRNQILYYDYKHRNMCLKCDAQGIYIP